jgi:hypothetical protein
MDDTSRSRPSDHDLLIELNTKFVSFETASDRMWRDVNDKMSRILLQMDEKADKQAVKFLQQNVDKLESRVNLIEAERSKETVRRETVINLGNMGIKTWTLIAGIIGLLITVMQLLNK